MLQNGRLARLVLKDALGLCTVLSRVHFGVWRSPLVPGAANTQKTVINIVFLSVLLYSVPLDDVIQLGR